MPKKGNGDREDIEEKGYWYCNKCGAGGPCVKGDESTALWLHEKVAHPNG